MGALKERLIPMADCDHREICRHKERTSNYKKLLGVIKDSIPLAPNIVHSPEGAIPIINYNP